MSSDSTKESSEDEEPPRPVPGVDRDKDGFIAVFAFNHIAACGLLTRFKLVQTVFLTGGIIPYMGYLSFTEKSTSY